MPWVIGRLNRFLRWLVNVPAQPHIEDHATWQPDGDWDLWQDLGGEG